MITIKKLYKLIMPFYLHEIVFGPIYRGLFIFYHILILKIEFFPNLDFYYYLSKKIDNSKVVFYDIGANKGQSINRAIKHFKRIHKIVAVEPVKNNELEKILKKYPELIDIYYNAIGCNGKTNINLHTNTGLNSLLDFNLYQKYHIDVEEFKGNQETECISLDDLADHYSNYNNDKFIKVLKIDTQGFEMNVLKSGERSILKHQFDIILIELILVGKYKNMPHWTETISYLNRLGFIVVDIKPFWRELDNLKVTYHEFGQFTEMDLMLIDKSSKLFNFLGLKS